MLKFIKCLNTKCVCRTIEMFGGKAIIMKLLSHKDQNVRYEALLALQKMMVYNWYGGCALTVSKKFLLNNMCWLLQEISEHQNRANIRNTTSSELINEVRFPHSRMTKSDGLITLRRKFFYYCLSEGVDQQKLKKNTHRQNFKNKFFNVLL